MAIARFGGNPGQGSWAPTGAGRGLASGWAVGAQIRQLKLGLLAKDRHLLSGLCTLKARVDDISGRRVQQRRPQALLLDMRLL